MKKNDALFKRMFDIFFSFSFLLIVWPVIILALIISFFETYRFGFYQQIRIGQYGKRFCVLKIRTMRDVTSRDVITVAGDKRITFFGKIFRRYKIDELPQLINILLGQMSVVGPRPDVPGYADRLRNFDRQILLLKPGITGPASLKYRHEEELLSQQPDPNLFNDSVIWPDKVRLNLQYLTNWTFSRDLSYIMKTIFASLRG